MTEIKLRVWDEVCGHYLNRPMHKLNLQVLNHKHYIVELFLGRQDKNGKDMYAGDILHFSGLYLLIVWHPPELCYVFKYTDERGQTMLYGDELWEGVEIVGNINENPELMEART